MLFSELDKREGEQKTEVFYLVVNSIVLLRDKFLADQHYPNKVEVLQTLYRAFFVDRGADALMAHDLAFTLDNLLFFFDENYLGLIQHAGAVAAAVRPLSVKEHLGLFFLNKFARSDQRGMLLLSKFLFYANLRCRIFREDFERLFQTLFLFSFSVPQSEELLIIERVQQSKGDDVVSVLAKILEKVFAARQSKELHQKAMRQMQGEVNSIRTQFGCEPVALQLDSANHQSEASAGERNEEMEFEQQVLNENFFEDEKNLENILQFCEISQIEVERGQRADSDHSKTEATEPAGRASAHEQLDGSVVEVAQAEIDEIVRRELCAQPIDQVKL